MWSWDSDFQKKSRLCHKQDCMIHFMKELSKHFSRYLDDEDLIVMVVTLMKLLKTQLHYVCMSTDGIWIVLDSFLLHLSWACTVCQCTLCKVLNKESKRDGAAGIAVNILPFIVLEIDPYLSIPCQVRSELSTKSMKRQLSILYCNICEW